MVLRSPNRDATLSELRLLCNYMRVPRVAKAQPWAGISERFQRKRDLPELSMQA